ncbi:hypothetical protein JTP77_042590, partial [Streptomyces sp. S9]|nr:hypothetical protein [Streptomyces sp. S9]
MRPIALLSLSLALCAALAAHAAPATRDYAVLMQGRPAGEQKVAVAADGSVRVDFHYTDRGRGDRSTTRWRANDDGTLREYSGSGN